MTRSLHKVFMFIISGLLLMSGLAIAQSEQAVADKPPIAQPLVREGDFAIKLADALKLGTVTSETEAENLLGSAGIEPRNGWIADYPVTPDIMGELQTSVSDAAGAGKLTMGKDEALKATQDVTSGFGLSIRTEGSAQAGQVGTVAAGTTSPETPVINNYYYDEGPPVVTYYAPPPDYAYMYSYVPYPFWGWNFWYPGFYVLLDFHVGGYGYYGYGHGYGWYGYGHGPHGGFVSNHYRGPTGGISRIDPANRSRGGMLPGGGGAGLSRPAVRSGGQAILNSSQGRARTGTSAGYRGYGNRPSTGTRSSVYEHSRNIRIERAASDRGYQNRSNAGRMTNGGRGGQGVSRGTPRGNVGGGGVFQGSGGGSRGGGGVIQGTGGGSRGSSGGSRGGGGGYNGAGRR